MKINSFASPASPNSILTKSSPPSNFSTRNQGNKTFLKFLSFLPKTGKLFLTRASLSKSLPMLPVTIIKTVLLSNGMKIIKATLFLKQFPLMFLTIKAVPVASNSLPHIPKFLLVILFIANLFLARLKLFGLPLMGAYAKATVVVSLLLLAINSLFLRVSLTILKLEKLIFGMSATPSSPPSNPSISKLTLAKAEACFYNPSPLQ